MIRTQISVEKTTYERAKRVSARHGISLAEFIRRSLDEKLAQEESQKPWMAFAGCIDGDIHDSSSVDDVVYGREQL
jgi:hypothetical protein